MAHFRRKKPKVRTFHNNGRPHRDSDAKGKELGITYLWLRQWPAWYDILMHRRPRRRETKRLERAVLMQRCDSDDTAWPTSGKKPHTYWW